MTDPIKRQMIITVITAALSMTAGFFAVYLFVGPPGSSEDEPGPQQASKAQGGAPQAGKKPPAQSIGESPSPAPEQQKPEIPASAGKESAPPAPAGKSPAPATQKGPEATSPPAAVPSEKSADGGKTIVSLTEFSVFRCWKDGEETPVEKEGCGKPPGFEELVKDNLGGISKCVKDFSGKEPGGKISLAMKIYFEGKRYRAWLGNSTTISGIEETSACVRQFYSSVPFKDMDHSFNTYLVFYNLVVSP
jgi:hypothetical protein